jgi:phospholipid/cholesterol/gamma-HCH transport system substrate-binding protein
MTGLKNDREAILGSLDSISALSVQTADLVTGIRPGLRRDVKGLRTVMGNIMDNRGEVDRALKVMPIKLNKVGRTAIYGSFFNFYLCNFRATIDLPGGAGPITADSFDTEAERCNIG